MPMPEHLTALEIARGVRAGTWSAVEVTTAALDRIQRLDPALHAFQCLNEFALADAAAVDARPDLVTLPLAGVPVAVKDVVDLLGSPTRWGSAATSDELALADDPLVTRLREAGAVIVGKTAMPELAVWGFTHSAAFGVTRNPWNLDRDPGGSSGGSAAAVAAGIVPVALASDGGGSIRIPSAYCGVVGLRPTPGLVPLPGGDAEHWCGLSSMGPIAGTVADVAAVYGVLCGDAHLAWAGQRETTAEVGESSSETPDPADTEPASAPSLKIAWSTRSPSPLARTSADGVAAVHQVRDLLTAQGHRVRPGTPPYGLFLIQRWTRRWHVGVYRDAQLLSHPSKLEPRTRFIVRKGALLTWLGGPREGGLPAWRRRLAQWFTAVDVVLTPTVAAPAPAAGWAQGRGYLGTLVASAKGVPFTQAWNLAGYPAMSVPVGLGSDGMPRSVQLIAAPHREEALLRAAALIQEHYPAQLAPMAKAQPPAE